MFSPARQQILQHHPGLLFPFPTSRISSVLEGNDLKTSEDSLKILFLECQSPENAVCTAASSVSSQMEIHLNHSSSAVVARNLIISSIISDPEFDVRKKVDLEYLWDVMYNSIWPLKTRHRFIQDVKKLQSSNFCRHNVKIQSSKDALAVGHVMNQWLGILERKHIGDFLRERKDFMTVQAKEELAMPEGDNIFSFLLTSMELGSVLYGIMQKVEISVFPVRLEEPIKEELAHYCRQGSTLNPSHGACVNPLLLEPLSGKWTIGYQNCPFNGYLPFEDGELDLKGQPNILKNSCLNILKNIIAKYKERVGTTEMYFHVADPLDFCYQDGAQYDVIDCGTLIDQHGLANVLNASSNRLSDKLRSRLVVGTVRWQEATPSLRHYIEEVLCCPLSFTPTLYGLRLANQAELGLQKPPYLNIYSVNLTCFTWKRSPVMRNIHLSISLPIQNAIESLSSKCFRQNIQEEDPSASQNYTPLTFFYVTKSFKKRLESGDSSIDLPSWEPPENFKLQNQTLEDWSSGKPVKAYSLKVKPIVNLLSILMGESKSHDLTLRVVLVPSRIAGGTTNKRFKDFNLSKVEFIDNIHLDVVRNERGLESFEFSFFMPEDHQLENHSCVLIDLKTGQQIINALPLEAFNVEASAVAFPFSKRTQEKSAKKDSPLRVASCLEMLDHFLLNIDCPAEARTVKDFKVSCDTPKWPCCSTHSVEVSLIKEKKGKQLNLSFPHAVLPDQAKMSLTQKSLCILLPKALLEIWPSDIAQEKLKMESLRCWIEPHDEDAGLSSHLNAQQCRGFLSLEFHRTLNRSLFVIRMGIFVIFTAAAEKAHQHFAIIFSPVGEESDELNIRVHLPIRKAPSGAPLLLVTVLDNKRAKTLVRLKKMSSEELVKSKKKVFAGPVEGGPLQTSQEVMDVWRYIFKLNSLKVSTRNWPVKNLQTGEDSPWLATFITPLYMETIGRHFEDHLDQQCEISVNKRETTPVKSDESPSFEVVKEFKCGMCGKTEGTTKRCSKCKVTTYCSVQCQRKDWRMHKKVCRKDF